MSDSPPTHIGYAEAPRSSWQFSLRSLLLLAIPIALFTVTIWRLLAKSAELRLPEKQIAGSFAVGAVVGIVVTTIFWSNGRRLFAVSIGNNGLVAFNARRRYVYWYPRAVVYRIVELKIASSECLEVVEPARDHQATRWETQFTRRHRLSADGIRSVASSLAARQELLQKEKWFTR